MAKRKRHKVTVEVTRVVNGTTHTRTFTARKASTQMWPDGMANVVLVDGFDENGPVLDVLFRQAEEITRRPKGKRS